MSRTFHSPINGSIEKPYGTQYITTFVAGVGIIAFLPYLFLKEQRTEPPIKNFKYNMIYIGNEFKTILSDIIHEKNFIFFLIAVIGIQYGPLYANTLFKTVQIDIFHASHIEMHMRENIFFWTHLICMFIIPPILHKYGPKFMLMINLILCMLVTSFQMMVVFSSVLSYIACVMCGIVNASMNVTIRRFIIENCTYDTISMHYGFVTILIKIMNSISILISLIYSFTEDLNFFLRYYAAVFIFFFLAVIGTIACMFSRDHHKEYKLGLRPPYLKYEILEEKE